MKHLSRSLAAALLSSVVLTVTPAGTTPVFAATMTVKDVVVGDAALAITIPSVEIVDGNMSEGDIRTLFKGDDVSGTAAKIKTWNATSISIPEVTFKQSVKTGDAEESIEFTYKGLTIQGLENGVAKSSRIEGGELKTTGKEAVNGKIGAFTTGLFDFSGLLAFYVGDGAGGGEMRTIYKDVAFDGMSLSGANNVKCEFGKFAAAEFKARPLKTPFTELARLAESMNNDKEASPADIQKFVAFYTDIFTGIESSTSTFDGMTCKLTDENGRPVDLRIGKIEMGGFGNARYPGITMNDFHVEVTGEGVVSIGKLNFKGMDFSGPLAAAKAAGDQISSAWFETNYRKVLPAFFGFGLSDVAIDVPDTDNPGQRVKAKVGSFDLTLNNHQLGIPADIALAAQNIAIDIPAETKDENLLQLRALGYNSVDVGFGAKVKWDEATNAIAIEELSATGVNMGTVNISGIIGNATKDLFAEDPGTQQGAAMGLSVKQLSVVNENEGLLDKAIEFSAKEQGAEPAEFRKQISGMAGGMIPMVLGGTDEAKKIADAVMAFVNGGKSLTLSAESKDEAGVGLMDLMAAQENPAVLAEKFNLSAEAQ